MSNIMKYIEDKVRSNTPDPNAKGLLNFICLRVGPFIELRSRGTLDPGRYRGVEQKIAERVVANYPVTDPLYVPPIVNIPATSTNASKPKVLTKFKQDDPPGSGFITWAGNVAMSCPIPFTFYDINDSNADTRDPLQTTQSNSFSTVLKGINK